MVAYNKFNQFVEDLGDAVHNFSTHDVKVYASNIAPAATNAVKADVAEITAQNGYPAGGSSVTPVWSRAAAIATLAGTDVVWTASGGSFGPLQYVLMYNDTPTSPADPLISWWIRASAVTVDDGDTFTVDFIGAGQAIFTLQ